MNSKSTALLLVFALTFCLHAVAKEPFDYFDNSWSVIGLKDYERGTRITPDNKLMIGASIGTTDNEADKASVQMRFGRDLNALGRSQTKRLMDGWLPVVLLTAEDGTVRYEFTMWATPLPSARDWQKAFDGPAEGENYLNWIAVRATNMGDAPATAKLSIEQAGPYEKGKHPVPSLATPWALDKPLGKGESVERCLALPWTPVDGVEMERDDHALWLDRTVAYWRGLIADAASIEVPCDKSTQTYLAAHVCQLIASDHGKLHGGEGFYDEFYIRDGAYQLMELEEAGFWDAARKAVESYVKSQRDDGRFESQKNQFDANGQALWVLWQYYKITGDRQWLERVYPQMQKSVEWMTQARKSNAADGPYAGLLPNAPADGEFLWDGKHHIVGYDFWNLRGLLCAADAASALGNESEAATWRGEAADYRKAIDAAWKQTGLPHFAQSWEKDGTHWGNTETLWPTPIFPENDPRVAALLDEVRTRHAGGFVEGTIVWTGSKELAIHPYMSAYTTMASLNLGQDEKVVEEFYWYLLHSTATHAFPEGIFPKRRFAWSNTIPHVTGASNYALLLRHMLVHEKGDELHLLTAVPDWWLDEGKVIKVKNAPTHFGTISLEVQGTAQGVRLQFDPAWRDRPSKVVVHLPEARPLENPEVAEAITRPAQKTRWDFDMLVERYDQSSR